MNSKRRPIILLLLSCLIWFIGQFAQAQSNQFIDSLLTEQEAGFGKCVYLVLASAGLIKENVSIDEALSKLQTLGWKIKQKAKDTPITLGEYALLLMKAYDARGGVMYSLFQNTRYACREIAYWDWLDENVSPYRTLSGDEAVDLLSQMLIRQAAQGGAQ